MESQIGSGMDRLRKTQQYRYSQQENRCGNDPDISTF
jgi:hypothetical protein